MKACALLIFTSTIFAATGDPAIHLSLSITEGERSRDSHSTTTMITLNGNQLIYDQFFSGFRASNRKSIHKKVRLTKEEISKLTKLINRTELLTSSTIERPANSYGTYTILKLSLGLEKKKSVISISGMSKEIEGEKLYRDVKALRQEIERIVGAQ